MPLSWPQKGPGENLDYALNWAQPLGTDAIQSSAWTLSSADIIETDSSFTTKEAVIWLSGGTLNTTYTVTNTITTVAGRVFVQQVQLPVRNS